MRSSSLVFEAQIFWSGASIIFGRPAERPERRLVEMELLDLICCAFHRLRGRLVQWNRDEILRHHLRRDSVDQRPLVLEQSWVVVLCPGPEQAEAARRPPLETRQRQRRIRDEDRRWDFPTRDRASVRHQVVEESSKGGLALGELLRAGGGPRR